MADKKITQLNNITGADLADADEFVVVDITSDETKAITFNELKTAFDTGTGFVRVTGDTMTGALNVESTITSDGMIVDGDVTFGDNDKAIFGAGSDLQIYHDGSSNRSYITESNTDSNGHLFIQGDNVILENTAGENYFRAVNGGASQIYYSGSEKLATTSTGIDVTGDVALSGDITSTDTIDIAANGFGKGVNLKRGNGAVNGLSLTSGGDISFYEDTGTTAKFFWDASTERLGLGTTSPQRPFHLNVGTDNTAARFQSTDTEVALEFIDPAGTAYFRASGDYIKMGATQSDSLTILDGGNVGIGTSSPRVTASVIGLTIGNSTIGGSELVLRENTGNDWRIFNNGYLGFIDDNTERMRINSSGAVIVGSAVASTNVELNLNGVASKATRIQFQEGGVNRWLLGQGAASETSAFELYNATGVQALSVNRTTNVATFAGGLAVPTGKGLTFADAGGSGTSTSNSLDSYEEGYHTYTVVGSTSGSWTPRAGWTQMAYTKIGRLVTVTGQIEISGSSSPNGEARISLPFAVASTNAQFSARVAIALRGRTTSNDGIILTDAVNANSYFRLIQVTDAGVLSFLGSSNGLDSTWEFNFTMTYMTA